MNVYVASSWRNPRQQVVVECLRAAGHTVYDFREPEPGVTGFSWKKVTATPPPWTAEATIEVLSHAESVRGFAADFTAMRLADAIVMVQPCGVSAALELGWATGAHKLTIALLADGQEPELMLRLADYLCTTLDEVVAVLALPLPHFNGPVYVAAADHSRLMRQHVRVREAMIDGQWRTLSEIAACTGDPPASVSAQLRHLRKARFGSWIVKKRARGNRVKGLFEYSLSAK